jgi:hypothetical protein
MRSGCANVNLTIIASSDSWESSSYILRQCFFSSLRDSTLWPSHIHGIDVGQPHPNPAVAGGAEPSYGDAVVWRGDKLTRSCGGQGDAAFGRGGRVVATWGGGGGGYVRRRQQFGEGWRPSRCNADSAKILGGSGVTRILIGKFRASAVRQGQWCT